MNKLPEDWENPYDVLLLRLSKRLLPALRATNHTPNVITTYSFGCCLLSRWFLWKDHIGYFVLFSHLGYFFDCVDGQFARTYNMVSPLGDVYDHATDIIGEVTLFAIVWHKYRHVMPLWCVALLPVCVFMLATAMGCQQLQYTGGHGGELLDANVRLCPSPSSIQWTRFFGNGTWQLAMTALVIFLHCRSTAKGTGL